MVHKILNSNMTVLKIKILSVPEERHNIVEEVNSLLYSKQYQVMIH